MCSGLVIRNIDRSRNEAPSVSISGPCGTENLPNPMRQHTFLRVQDRLLKDLTTLVCFAFSLGCTQFARVSAADFGPNSASISNRYYPINVGAKWTYSGIGVIAGVTGSHQATAVENVDGVQCIKVVVNAPDGMLYEWYAQDTSGAVWRLRQYDVALREYDEEDYLIMPANPKVGERYTIWSLEYEVASLSAQVTVPAGTFSNCLQLRSIDDAWPDEQEYYAPSVGEIKAADSTGGYALVSATGVTPVANPLMVTTPSPLPAAFLGVAYSATNTATGGTAPYTWSLASGILSASLQLTANGIIAGMPTNSGTAMFTVNVTDSKGASATKSLTLPVLAPKISFVSLGSNAIIASSADALDAPLEVKPDTATVASQTSPVEGLVADGVTPLLIRVSDIPQDPGPYDLDIKVSGGLVDLKAHLFTLSNNKWATGGQLAVSGTPDAYALIKGVDREQISFSPDVTELSVDVVLRRAGVPMTTSPLKLRFPPVVLVHGIGSTATWEFSSSFLTEFYKHVPDSFVVRAEYGVDNGNDPTLNQVSPLPACAALLSDSLVSSIETSGSPIRSKWAFTRYDIIGHSQGGVILRYLAQPKALSNGAPAFKNADNFWRGRFDRIVTIGSPHNGSLNYFYSYALYHYWSLQSATSARCIGFAEFAPKPTRVNAQNDGENLKRSNAS
jgi:pimeloyl-ACP methyl ester carboxylesterase